MSAAIALSEAKRGAGDPLYGYYTMGKLAILKLRDDYTVKAGTAFSLQQFHDAFIAVGTSCRHQVEDLAHKQGQHPAVFLRNLLDTSPRK